MSFLFILTCPSSSDVRQERHSCRREILQSRNRDREKEKEEKERKRVPLVRFLNLVREWQCM
jgi:hypothetical protein